MVSLSSWSQEKRVSVWKQNTQTATDQKNLHQREKEKGNDTWTFVSNEMPSKISSDDILFIGTIYIICMKDNRVLPC